MSNTPWRGAEKAATSPGVVKVAGIITVTPWTFGKPAQRQSLVGDAVLHAEDRLAGHPGGPQSLQRGHRVLGLHGQQDHVVRADADLGGVGEAGKVRARRPLRGPQQQPARPDRLELGAPGDADDGWPASASAAATVPPIAPTP